MLINCPECGKEISDKCGNCPQCGFPVEVQEILYEYEGKQYNIINIVKDIKENNSSNSFSLIHRIFDMPDSVTAEEFAKTTEKNDLIYDEIIDKYCPEDAEKGYYRSNKFREKFRKQQAINNRESNQPKCPICNSADIVKISIVKKTTKVGLFGIFGAGDIGKTWKCNNCGSKF